MQYLIFPYICQKNRIDNRAVKIRILVLKQAD